ncbi:MAG: 3-phosphoshikimate 1-carboxyvinyltransferase [Bacteroidales bacterium]|jgi:3-phosphoshikimate 1-carboxyvinyltransferase|nr:3-phosphoshikimate 1-carboxyvinyltransferase [Bacteroidales bacterium]
MRYLITRPQQSVHGRIHLPASKSISNRVLIISKLSYNPYPIENLSDSDDTQVLLKALQSNDLLFDTGAAGTAMRFLTAYLSTIYGEWRLTGSNRMKQRPIKILVDALNKLGGKIEYLEKEGFPPLKIYGSTLSGGEITLDGGVSSQYISALLMIAPVMENGLTLHLTGTVISRPYIKLTLRILEEFGILSEWNENTIRIRPQEYVPQRYQIEADWSAASYWYQIMSLSDNAEIELLHLFPQSFQGDAAVIHIFKKLGVKTILLHNGIRLQPAKVECEKFEYDFSDQPDLAQTLTVTCALKGIPFQIGGLQSLRIKETDRIAALKSELKKLGYMLEQPQDNVLAWNGIRCEPEKNPVIDTYEDHRMAMSFAPVALKCGSIIIEHPEVVSKSYPAFWNDLSEAGFNIDS